MQLLYKLEQLLKEQSSKDKNPFRDIISFEKIIRPEQILNFPNGNTIFSNKVIDLKIPAIIQGDLSDIELGTTPAFIDSENDLIEVGIKNFVLGKTLNSKTNILICDNHNYVLEAWQLLKEQHPVLIHIDQHRDDATSTQLSNLYHTRICDYIDFAIRNRLIQQDIISIIESNDLKLLKNIPTENKICNIDIDIFEPDCTVLTLEQKVACIITAAKNSHIITLATSPGFIPQNLAIKIAKLLWKYL